MPRKQTYTRGPLGVALALLVAGPALATEFPAGTEESFVEGAPIYQYGDPAPPWEPDPSTLQPWAEESFVQGAQIYQPGYRPNYAGQGIAPALHASGPAPVYDVPHSSGLTLQRPWSESEEALGVFN